jgi:hypothetical protein
MWFKLHVYNELDAFRSAMKSAFTLLAIFILAAAVSAEDGLAVLRFLVVRESNGKPIRNAAVVLHPVNNKGKQARGGMELKCDADGKADYDGVPYGKLRIQVLAQGFQTYGEDFDISQPEKEIVIRMKRPAEQYSIYTDKQNTKKDDGSQKDSKPQQ